MRKPALKQILLSFLLATVSFLLITVLPVNAQRVNSYAAPVSNPDVPQNLHTYTQSAMIEVMSAMICQLSGVDPIQPTHQCLGIDPLSQRIGYVQGTQDGVAGGALGTISNLIGYAFEVPISSGHYFNYLVSNFGITKSAFGATTKDQYGNIIPDTTGNTPTNQSAAPSSVRTGFESLAPLMTVWARVRDVVYVIFVIGFIIVGIGIMLRVKIDPRTVMTIQNRIPKIIAGILLVTFSYAIAGFLIDIMWVSIYLIINLFASVDPKIASDINTYYALQGGNVFNYASSTLDISNVTTGANQGVKEIISAMLNNSAGHVISYAIAAMLTVGSGAVLGKIGGLGTALLGAIKSAGPIGWLVGLVAGGAVAGATMYGIDKMIPTIAGYITYLIILIAICSALFRLWFKLLAAFIGLIFGLVLGPLWIFAGLIPGNKLGFGSWLKHMLTNLIVFPMAIGMFMVGKVTIDAYAQYQQLHSAQGFVPPLIGYGGTGAPISALVALGLILITPNVTKFAQDIFKGQKLDVSPIGQSLKAGTGTITGGIKPIGGAMAPNPMHPSQQGKMRRGFWGAAGKLGFG
jgi:hypothetical protein